MKRFVATVAMALALGTGAAVADQAVEAAAAEGARAIPVRFDDLDLDRADDAQALLSRLRYAATRACEVSAVARPGPALRRQIEECHAAALDEAVRQADSPEVSRLYSEQRR